jgi:glycerol kinase
LVIDPYFSATKIMWLFENSPELRKRAEAGEICFGTVDSFLLSRLTRGEVHATDYTNASRTMLFDIKKLCWDEELLKLFRIPPDILPETKPSGGYFGDTNAKFFGKKTPVMSVIGDQQAALFGQAGFTPGVAKNTYGTGCFLLVSTGSTATSRPKSLLLSTVAWAIGSKRNVTYAREGSVLAAGAALQWLKDGLRIYRKSSEIEKYSLALGNNDGVYFVPALTGLGAPYWDPLARGLMIGITGGTTRANLVRACLEAICFLSCDIFSTLQKEIGKKIGLLRADGGVSANDPLMQFQADIMGVRIQRPLVTDTTALGAALLAALSTGFWKSTSEIANSWRLDKEFLPDMDPEKRKSLHERWKDAVSRSRSWARDG